MTSSTAQQAYDRHPEIEASVAEGLAAPRSRQGHPGKPTREEEDVR